MALEPKEILDKILKLPITARAGILAGFYMVFVSLYYIGVYTEKETELAKKTTQYDAVYKKLVETQNYASQIDNFIEEVEKLKEELARAQDQLPLETRMDVLIEQITRIGKDNGLQFTKIVPGKETQRGFYAEIPIAFDVQGKYHALGLFFNELAGQTRIINASDLVMERTAADSIVLKAKFQATTYRQVQQPPPGADSGDKDKNKKGTTAGKAKTKQGGE